MKWCRWHSRYWYFIWYCRESEGGSALSLILAARAASCCGCPAEEEPVLAVVMGNPTPLERVPCFQRWVDGDETSLSPLCFHCSGTVRQSLVWYHGRAAQPPASSRGPEQPSLQAAGAGISAWSSGKCTCPSLFLLLCFLPFLLEKSTDLLAFSLLVFCLFC